MSPLILCKHTFKLQRNWCYKYVGRVGITEIPVTERFVERHKNKELYLDKEKVDFKNITPVFSGRDGSSLSFFKKLNSQKKEEELRRQREEELRRIVKEMVIIRIGAILFKSNGGIIISIN